MSKATFEHLLRREILSVKCNLLNLYEGRSELLYKTGPYLEEAYMSIVGEFEQKVIRKELECTILKRTQQLVQAAVNRREPIDGDMIDSALEQYRKKLFEEAEGDEAGKGFADLSPEEERQLKELYHDIVDRFHPQQHPDLNQVQRQLFERAQVPYQRKDLQTLQLIWELLDSLPEDEETLELLQAFLSDEENEESDDKSEYALASAIYPCFRPLSKEAGAYTQLVQYRQIAGITVSEIEALCGKFPYNTAELLGSPEKIQAYKAELEDRMKAADKEYEQRTSAIKEMIEKSTNHE